MGAYTICAASQFNGFEVSRVIYTVGGGSCSSSDEGMAVFEQVKRTLIEFTQERVQGLDI